MTSFGHLTHKCITVLHCYIIERLESEGWIKKVELSSLSKTFALGLSDTLGEGEAQAIALALEKKDRLFIDDLKGRVGQTIKLFNCLTVCPVGIKRVNKSV